MADDWRPVTPVIFSSELVGGWVLPVGYRRKVGGVERPFAVQTRGGGYDRGLEGSGEIPAAFNFFQSCVFFFAFF